MRLGILNLGVGFLKIFKGRPTGNDLKGRAVFEFVSGNLFGVTFLGPVLTGDLKETTLNIGVPNTL